MIFFSTVPPTTEIYTLPYTTLFRSRRAFVRIVEDLFFAGALFKNGSDHLRYDVAGALDHYHVADANVFAANVVLDRKSTRLNSSHITISYAVFCLKKKQRSAHYSTL